VTNEGRVVLLDFGLVAELDKEASLSTDKIAGTPRYMAPEQAAGQPVTSACDWYAVGVMLYESLAGKPPFAGAVMQVVHDKQWREAPALPPVGLPADLVDLCMRLLARAPEQRPNALAIAKALAACPQPEAPPTFRKGQGLVGRTTHLVQLR